MNLCIDIGNTTTKAAIFEADKLLAHFTNFGVDDFAKLYKQGIDRCLISKSGENRKLELAIEEVGKYELLSAQTALPITLDYKTPDTLGPDRIAKAVAAYQLYPRQNAVLVDAGTCLTIDLLDKNGVFHGGIISPGAQMRLNAMHRDTAALPKVEYNMNVTFPGKSTEESMQVGVYQSIVHEINGYISALEAELGSVVVLDCSTHNMNFEKGFNYKIFAHPKFVLQGLNVVANQHV